MQSLHVVELSGGCLPLGSAPDMYTRAWFQVLSITCLGGCSQCLITGQLPQPTAARSQVLELDDVQMTQHAVFKQLRAALR